MLFFSGGFSIYYFITLIIQYYLLLPVLNKYGSTKLGLVLSALISGSCMIFLFYITKIKGISLPLIVYAGPFPVWIVFFVLGIYIGKKGKASIPRNKLLILTLVGLSLSIAETYMNINIANSFTGLGIKRGAFIYSFFLIMYLFTYKDTDNSSSPLWQLMVYIGKISFGIYLIHIYFLSYLIRSAVNSLSISNYFKNQGLLIGLTLLSCMIIIYFARKINKSVAVKYLGF